MNDMGTRLGHGEINLKKPDGRTEMLHRSKCGSDAVSSRDLHSYSGRGGFSPCSCGIKQQEATPDSCLEAGELRARLGEYEYTVGALSKRVLELKDRVRNLESRCSALLAQSLAAQNSESIRKLEEIFNIDPDSACDPSELEGTLSRYSDDQTSAGWVRSVRDGC